MHYIKQVQYTFWLAVYCAVVVTATLVVTLI